MAAAPPTTSSSAPTFAWVLGLGVFFLAVYTTHAATGNSTANVNVLFGSIFGISAGAAAAGRLDRARR